MCLIRYALLDAQGGLIWSILIKIACEGHVMVTLDIKTVTFLKKLKSSKIRSTFRAFRMQVSAKFLHISKTTPSKTILSFKFIIGTTRNKSPWTS